jgi:hypothetical protein
MNRITEQELPFDFSPSADKRPLASQESTIDTPINKDIPSKYRSHYKKGMEGKSRKSAIRAQCLACCGWSSKEVRHCTSKDCTLHKFRITG